jgi:hypothetical protein
MIIAIKMVFIKSVYCEAKVLILPESISTSSIYLDIHFDLSL